jgi:hypothetical protein
MGSLFLQWLYIDAPRAYRNYAKEISLGLYNFFSIPLLFSTSTQPWRHDSVDITRVPIRFWPQVFINNVTSRMIGFVIRFSVIMLGCFCLFLFTLISIGLIIGWYLGPILLLYSAFYGVSIIVEGGL